VKVCKSCGVDVSAGKRIRNPDGTYFCAACWRIQSMGPGAGIKGLDLLPPGLDLASKGLHIAGAGAGIKGLDVHPKSANRTPEGADAGIQGLDLLPPDLDVRPSKERPRVSRGSDFPTNDVSESAMDELYYPCRICENLFTAAEVYAEADGETVCKSCWGSSDARVGVDTGLVSGLALTPAPIPQRHAREDLFCERCNGVFLAKQLTISPDGAVLCRRCGKITAETKRQAEREAKHKAQFSAISTPAPKRRGSTSGNKTAITVGICVLAIAWALYRLVPSEWLHEKSARGHRAATSPSDRPAH
jgi:hypothetical protein